MALHCDQKWIYLKVQNAAPCSRCQVDRMEVATIHAIANVDQLAGFDQIGQSKENEVISVYCTQVKIDRFPRGRGVLQFDLIPFDSIRLVSV